MTTSGERIVALAGGVGGAKMAHGLMQVVSPRSLTVIVNTADDFDHYGLRICPDLDTVMYTLAGIANPVTGWGVAGDTRRTLDGIAAYGRDPWFLIGDRDLATHILRSDSLGAGARLTDVTAGLAGALGVQTTILPMTDDRVATIIQTPGGDLAFQDYFVRRKQKDEVIGVRFDGIDRATPTPEVLAAIDAATLIVFCPSNPLVSLGPILALAGVRDSIGRSRAPRVAVSPIVAGKALKGPADRMLASMGFESTAAGVASIYRELVDGMVIDRGDRSLVLEIEALGPRVLTTDAIMRDEADRARLAGEIVEFGRSLRQTTIAV
jgi:LPPG:FO 2-phospho-L-lactate transferase